MSDGDASIHFRVARDTVTGRGRWRLCRGHAVLAEGEVYPRLTDVHAAIGLVRGTPGNGCVWRLHADVDGRWRAVLLAACGTEPIARSGPYRDRAEAELALRTMTSAAAAAPIIDDAQQDHADLRVGETAP